MKKFFQLGISLALTVLVGYLIYRGVPDWGLAWRVMIQARPQFLLAGLGFVLLHMLLRAVRWGVLLSPVKRGISLKNLFSLTLIKYTVNIIPPRAGEVAASFLLLPIIMIDVVSLTNRFAGPILRLRRSVRALAAGDYVDPIFFRDNDYWQEFAIEFNALSRHVEELKQELAQANKKLAAQTSSEDEKTSELAPSPVSFSELPPTQPAGAR